MNNSRQQIGAGTSSPETDANYSYIHGHKKRVPNQTHIAVPLDQPPSKKNRSRTRSLSYHSRSRSRSVISNKSLIKKTNTSSSLNQDEKFTRRESYSSLSRSPSRPYMDKTKQSSERLSNRQYRTRSDSRSRSPTKYPVNTASEDSSYYNQNSAKYDKKLSSNNYSNSHTHSTSPIMHRRSYTNHPDSYQNTNGKPRLRTAGSPESRNYRDEERRQASSRNFSNIPRNNSYRSRSRDRSRDRFERPNASQNKYHSDYEDRDRYAGDYTSICLKNLNDHIMLDKMREFIYHEFRHYKNFTVKIVHNKKPPSDIYAPNSERICFVNFSNHVDARRAKQSKMNKLFYGLPLYIEPVFRNRGPPPPVQSSAGAGYYGKRVSPVSRASNQTRRSRNRSVSPRPSRSDSRLSPAPRYSRSHSNSRNLETKHSDNRREETKTVRREKNSAESLPGSRKGTEGTATASRSRSPSTSLLAKPVRTPPDIDEVSIETTSVLPALPAEPVEPVSVKIENVEKEEVEQVAPPKSVDMPKIEEDNLEKAADRSDLEINKEKSPVSEWTESSISKNLAADINTSSSESDSSHSPRSRNSSGSSARQSLHDVAASTTETPLITSTKIVTRPESQQRQTSKDDSERRRRRSHDRTKRRDSTSDNENKRNRSPPRSKYSYNSSGSRSISDYFDNDEKDATRTLFIGNLDKNTSYTELKTLFERYGVVDEIDIKRNQSAPTFKSSYNGDYANRKTYAFLKYINMDMAAAAKYHMNGKKIGKSPFRCKIGYGKVQPTNCLWVGGLTEKSRRDDLEQEFEYYAQKTVTKSVSHQSETERVHKLVEVLWRPNGSMEALLLFNTISQAEEARIQMRGRSLPQATSEKLRIDYADPKKFRAAKEAHAKADGRSESKPRDRSSLDNKKEISSEERSVQQQAKQTKSTSPPASPRSQPIETTPPTTATTTETATASVEQAESSPATTIPQIPISILPAFVTLKSQTSTKSVISPAFVDRTLAVTESGDSHADSSERILKNGGVSGPKKMLLINQGELENIVITATDNQRKVEKASNLNRVLSITEGLLSSPLQISFVNTVLEPPSKPTDTSTTAAVPATTVTTKQSDELSKELVTAGLATSINEQNGHSLKRTSSQTDLNSSSIKSKKSSSSRDRTDQETRLESSKQKSPEYSKSSSHRHHKSSKYPKDDARSNGVDPGISSRRSESKSKSEAVEDTCVSPIYSSQTTKLIKEGLISRKIEKNRHIKAIDTLQNNLSANWSGMFTLKKHFFPTKFYLLAGNRPFAEQILPRKVSDATGDSCLRISQRLRLEQNKLDELERKLYDHNQSVSRSHDSLFAVLLALPTPQLNNATETNVYQQHSLYNLISYLDQKCAAGVIPLPDEENPQAMMHAFTPNCQISNKLVKQLFANLERTLDNSLANSDFMIIILFKHINAGVATNAAVPGASE